mgnify:CR=1 FL=1
MEMPISKRRRILRYNGEALMEIMDEIVTEYAITIYINEQELATMVCTPLYLEHLVIGFLASEGIIRSFEQIENLLIDENKGMAYVTIGGGFELNQQLYNKRYITSCCGKSRQSFYFYNDAQTAKVVSHETTLSIPDVFRLMAAMQDQSISFHRTGGLHNAALCSKDSVLVARSDIGRHNALDKIYGHCLQHGISLDDKIIAFSGRISSEIILKVSKIGAAIILSKSAPTELALDMAEQLGITAIGFIRGNLLNIYSHPERIKETATGS